MCHVGFVNDKYGFMNGDEVIKFTSDVIQGAVQKYGAKGDFVGHVGGDDFVAIVNLDSAPKVSLGTSNNLFIFSENLLFLCSFTLSSIINF